MLRLISTLGVEPGSEATVSELMRGRPESILGALKISLGGTQKPSDYRLLVLTEVGPELYRPKPFSKGLELARRFSWFEIVSISDTPQFLTLTFRSGSFNFDHTSALLIIDAIMAHLHLILPDSDLPEVSSVRFADPGPTGDPYRGFYRLRARIYEAEGTFPDEIGFPYRVFLISRPITIHLADFNQYLGNAMIEFLDSLAVVPSVSSVSMPRMGIMAEPVWEGIANCLSSSRSIESFTTHELLADSFSKFASILIEKPPAKLNHLGFLGQRFSGKAVQSIRQLVAELPISSLACSSGLDIRFVPAFLEQEIASSKQLQSLSLDHLIDLPISCIFKVCGTLESLSLIYCGISIPGFLKTAGLTPGFSVVNLNLSGNTASRGFGQTFTFPPSIQKLAMNDVQWGSRSLTVTFRHCLLAPNLKHLELQSTGLPAVEVDVMCAQVLSKTELQPAPIGTTSLFWDENPVTPEFVRLLERMPSLRTLSLNQSISEAGPPSNLLLQYLTVNETIEDLRVASSPVLAKLFEVLRLFNRTIKSLSIREAPIDLEDLAETLLANRVLKYVDFRGSRASDIKTLNAFVRKVGERGVSLEIPVGWDDLTLILETQKCGLDGLANFMKSVLKLKEGDPSVAVPRETIERSSSADRVSFAAPGQLPAVEQESALLEPPANEWDFEVEDVPLVDSSEILREFEGQFTVDQLLRKWQGMAADGS
jgi:hypothetical protein